MNDQPQTSIANKFVEPSMYQSHVEKAQRPLREKYRQLPESAMVTDQAKTCGLNPANPFHFNVKPMPLSGVALPVGVHQAVGGPHDAPTPGDILCAALAACQDSTLRMIANILGIQLDYLKVAVSANVDVRGTLAMSRLVPVGFQSIDCDVQFKAKPGTPDALLKKLQAAALESCVIQQTLKNPPPVKTDFNAG